MGYPELLNISKLMASPVRLSAFARYYKSLTINGLHYIHHIDGSNAIAICKPDYHTHHEGTSFLLSRLTTGDRINTVSGHARNLKKFLDFLMIWNLEDDLPTIHQLPLKSGGPYPLEIILLSFTDYLRCIPRAYKPFNKLKIPNHAIQWTMLKHVPLNQYAEAEGKLLPVIHTYKNELKQIDWCEYPPGALEPIILTACSYLHYLKHRTKLFENLPLEQIPIKEVMNKHSLVSVTLGARSRVVYDAGTITRDSGVIGPQAKRGRQANPIEFSAVISENDANSFFKMLNPYNDAQDLLLFTILRYFGLRPGEASSLQINPITLSIDYHSAREQIMQTLSGNLAYIKKDELIGTWVINTGWKTAASQRSVPLITHRTMNPKTGAEIRFPTQDEFTDLLYWALIQRHELMAGYAGNDHGYLFVSASNNSRGKPLSEKGVYSKFHNVANALWVSHQIDLRTYYPHAFRHLFATTLLHRYRRSLEDIKQWLGHASVSITRNTYIHWIPDPSQNSAKGTVAHMSNTYKQQAEISKNILSTLEGSD